jgi:hypothetical protein
VEAMIRHDPESTRRAMELHLSDVEARLRRAVDTVPLSDAANSDGMEHLMPQAAPGSLPLTQLKPREGPATH